jgi:hypothetical protein
MEGFVYVMSNPAMPGLVKVGMTRKMPHLRAEEISAHEGLPMKMRLEYYALVSVAPRTVEQAVHQKLSSQRAGKEWFRCDCSVAIAAIKAIATNQVQHERFVYAEREAAEREHERERTAEALRRKEADDARAAQGNRESKIQRLLTDFHGLQPLARAAFYRHTSVLRGIADSFNPVTWAKETFGVPDPSSQFERVTVWPLPDVLVLNQYNTAKYLLSKAGRLPKKGWIEREIKGDFLVVPQFVIDEYVRRMNAASDKTPFTSANYADMRELW